MKERHNLQQYIYNGVTAVLVVVVAVLVVFAFIEREALFAAVDRVLEILAPIIYGAVLAFLLAPIYNIVYNGTVKILEKRKGGAKIAAAAAKTAGTVTSVLFLYVVIAGLFSIVIPQLYASILGIFNTMPVYIQNISNWITAVFANNPPIENAVLTVYQQLVDQFREWTGTNLIPNLQNLHNLGQIIGDVSNGVMGVINLAKNIFIGLIVMIYLLNIKTTLAAQAKKIVYTVLPLRAANATVDEFRYIHKVFSGFIIGKLIDSLIIGVLCFLLMRLFHMPFDLLISVIIGVTNIIPFFGPFIGAIPSAVLVFLISPLRCVYFILLIVVLQQFDGNILGPKILGNSTGLSSFWVLFSILLFGGLFGFAGMIMAVPVTAVIFDVMAKVQYGFLRKKRLSPDTRDYLNLDRIDEENGTYIDHDHRWSEEL